jgi:hypothetical protein
MSTVCKLPRQDDGKYFLKTFKLWDYYLSRKISGFYGHRSSRILQFCRKLRLEEGHVRPTLALFVRKPLLPLAGFVPHMINVGGPSVGKP